MELQEARQRVMTAIDLLGYDYDTLEKVYGDTWFEYDTLHTALKSDKISISGFKSLKPLYEAALKQFPSELQEGSQEVLNFLDRPIDLIEITGDTMDVSAS